MAGWVRGLLVVAAAGTVSFSPPVLAGTVPEPTDYESCEEAFDTRTDPFPIGDSCVEYPDGRVFIEEGGSPTDIERGNPFAGVFAMMIIFGLAWTAIPVFIAARMATERSESVGMAVILALAFGWVGLAIFYFMTNDRQPVRRRETAHSRTTASATVTTKASARLQELEDLRTTGLVTEDEYAQRRSAIIDAI